MALRIQIENMLRFSSLLPYAIIALNVVHGSKILVFIDTHAHSILCVAF